MEVAPASLPSLSPVENAKDSTPSLRTTRTTADMGALLFGFDAPSFDVGSGVKCRRRLRDPRRRGRHSAA